jgi:hypothetical protein
MTIPGDHLFEAFCHLRGIGYRRIAEAAAKRPDYEIEVNRHHLLVEVKVDPIVKTTNGQQ